MLSAGLKSLNCNLETLRSEFECVLHIMWGQTIDSCGESVTFSFKQLHVTASSTADCFHRGVNSHYNHGDRGEKEEGLAVSQLKLSQGQSTDSNKHFFLKMIAMNTPLVIARNVKKLFKSRKKEKRRVLQWVGCNIEEVKKSGALSG